MTSENKFKSVLADIFAIYQQADPESEILKAEVIPVKFLEQDPTRILDSFQKHTTDKNKTSILKKYTDGKYSESAYELYHDLKIASSHSIIKYRIGSKQYKDIDFFYKFATEVLLREVSRINISIFNNESTEQTELELQLKNDFKKISSSYTLSNGEVVTYLLKTQEPEKPTASPYATVYNTPSHVQQPTQSSTPLFSSLIGKSEIDTNATLVADPYSVAKAIPTGISSTKGTLTLGALSPANPRFMTNPDHNHEEILHDFFHPLWYTIPVPTWLNYKSDIIKPPTSLPIQPQGAVPVPSASSSKEEGNTSTIKPKLSILQQRNNGSDPTSSVATLVKGPGDSFRSFAPNIDSRDAIVSEEFKGKVWLNHIGFTQLEELKKNYLSKTSTIIESDKPKDPEDNNDDKVLENPKSTETPQTVEVSETKEFSEPNESNEINVQNLIDWNPENFELLSFLKDKKESITSSAKSLQRLISTLLLKLNKLRQERFLHSDAKGTSHPSREEISLYNKISKLVILAINLHKVSPGDFSYKFSKNLPVLTNDFSGVLPGIAQSKLAAMPVQNSTNRRLPSIRGPYKKKNRF